MLKSIPSPNLSAFSVSLSVLAIVLSMLFAEQAIFAQPRRAGNSVAKPSGTITGKIIDGETKKALLRATVTLHNLQDSSQISGGYTDKSGNFTLNVNNGNYYVKINFLGYEPVYIRNIAISQDKLNYNCGTISLKVSAVMTTEVRVEAEREAIEIGLDRKVFNIEQDITSLGGSAIDVLSNIPSVTVDQDDNVSLRGNANVKILIDGRVSDLSAADALNQIPATMISSIELITNPGARYEADGTAGMINIVTTRQRDDGWNAMINLNAGTNDVFDEQFSGSLSANYNIRKWNIFANFSGRSGSRSGISYQDRTMWDNNGIASYMAETDDGTRGNRFFSGKIGVDYSFSMNDILTYSFRINKMRRMSSSDDVYYMYDDNYDMTNYYTRLEENKPPFGTNTENTLSYKHNFKQKGNELYVDLFYTTMDRSGTDNYFQNNYLSPDFVESVLSRQSNYSSSNSQNFAVQTDYAVPIGTNFRLEAGGKFSSRISDIDNHLDDLINDEWVVNPNTSDKFEYNEKVAAAYITASSTFGDFKYNVGVRSETTIIDFISQKDHSINFNDNYTMFFPSVYFAYDLNMHHQFNANLASRMRRPSYWDLNPITNYEDPLNLRKGNAHLRPESHYLGEVGYFMNYDNTTLTATLFYRYSVDGIERYKRILNGDTTISMPENISSSLRTGLDLILMQKVTDWWKLNANFSMFNNQLDATNIGGSTRNAYNWNARLNSQMNFNKAMDFTLTGSFRSKTLRAQGESKANWNMDASFRYTLNSALSLSLRVQDIFNTRQWDSYEFIPGVLRSDFHSENNSRSVFLGITYKLNDFKQKKERQFDTDSRSAESEE